MYYVNVCYFSQGTSAPVGFFNLGVGVGNLGTNSQQTPK